MAARPPGPGATVDIPGQNRYTKQGVEPMVIIGESPFFWPGGSTLAASGDGHLT